MNSFCEEIWGSCSRLFGEFLHMMWNFMPILVFLCARKTSCRSDMDLRSHEMSVTTTHAPVYRRIKQRRSTYFLGRRNQSRKLYNWIYTDNIILLIILLWCTVVLLLSKTTSLHSTKGDDWFWTKHILKLFLAVGRYARLTRIPSSAMVCMHWLVAFPNGCRRPAWKFQWSLNFSFHFGFAVFCVPIESCMCMYFQQR